MFIKLRHLQFMLLLVSVKTLDAGEENYEADQEHQICDKMCTSIGCEEAADEIIRSLNESVNPCDDFYMHSCGGWIENHPDSSELHDANQMKVLQLKLQLELTEILEDNETPENDMMGKVKDYYHSCKDLAAIDARDLKPLEAIVSENGGWPLILRETDWSLDDKNLTLQKIHVNYAKLAARSAFFVIDVDRNSFNGTGYSLQLMPPSLFPMYVNNRQRPIVPQIKKLDFYYRVVKHIKYIKSVAEEFIRFQRYSVSPGQMIKDLWEILILETSLAEMYSGEMKRYFDDTSLVRSKTIEQVQNMWNRAMSERPEFKIDWLEMIRSHFEGTGIVIDSKEKIEFMTENILPKLVHLLKKTSLRTAVNYVHWYGIDGLMKYTNKQMRKNKNSYYSNHQQYNEDDEEQRPIFCIQQHKMVDGLSYAYMKKHVVKNVWSIPLEMVKEIQEEMKWHIHLSSWMDQKAKVQSKKNIDDMIKNLQYPNWYDEPEKIDNYYNELVVGKNYFENVINYNRFEMIKKMKKLRQSYNRDDEILSFLPIKVNSFYDRDTNSLNVPASFFKMPIFEAQRPLVMNYGSLGFIIGHEMAHGFDNQDLKYSKYGNSHQWWSQSTMASYRQKAQCFVEQYNNYTLFNDHMNKTIKINGERTLEENIADYIAATVALNAYLSYKDSNTFKDISIQALQTYTDLQLFFYSFSNHFCASLGHQSLENYKSSRHSSFPVRVNGVVSNMPEFAKAFSCPSGSPMNPVKKCPYWK